MTDYAIYMLDPDGIVTSWNAGARRFKGYEASEIIGQHFSRFYPEEDRTAGLPARVLEISKRTSKFEGEGWRVRKDGSQFWAFRLHTSEPRREPADARYHAAWKARTGSPPAMNPCATCRLNSMLWERCQAMAFIP